MTATAADPRAAPFDGAAATYDAVFGVDPVAQVLRRRVWSRIEAHLHGPSLLLDVGCGTGIDALHLARLGHTVIAADASAAMIHELERKRAAAPDAARRIRTFRLDANDPGSWDELVRRASLERDKSDSQAWAAGGRVDLLYADFGVLNCIADLGLLRDVAARVLRPTGTLVLVPMPPICPWELLALPRRGRGALRRLARNPVARVGDAEIPIHYPSLVALRRAMAPSFRVTRVAPLGLLLPAPAGARLPTLLVRALDVLDRAAAALPLVRRTGDHLLVELKRRRP